METYQRRAYQRLAKAKGWQGSEYSKCTMYCFNTTSALRNNIRTPNEIFFHKQGVWHSVLDMVTACEILGRMQPYNTEVTEVAEKAKGVCEALMEHRYYTSTFYPAKSVLNRKEWYWIDADVVMNEFAIDERYICETVKNTAYGVHVMLSKLLSILTKEYWQKEDEGKYEIVKGFDYYTDSIRRRARRW